MPVPPSKLPLLPLLRRLLIPVPALPVLDMLVRPRGELDDPDPAVVELVVAEVAALPPGMAVRGGLVSYRKLFLAGIREPLKINQNEVTSPC